MPGTRLVVKSSEDCQPDKRTIVIVLAWQYYEQIKNKLICKGFTEDEILKPMLLSFMYIVIGGSKGLGKEIIKHY